MRPTVSSHVGDRERSRTKSSLKRSLVARTCRSASAWSKARLFGKYWYRVPMEYPARSAIRLVVAPYPSCSKT